MEKGVSFEQVFAIRFEVERRIFLGERGVSPMTAAGQTPHYDDRGDDHLDSVMEYRASLEQDRAFQDRVRRVRDAIDQGDEPENPISAEKLEGWLRDVESGRAVRPE